MSMLQNLKPDKRKEKSWKMWNRILDKEYPEEGRHNVLGYKRFNPYTPNEKSYTKDFLTDYTGVYVMEDGYGFIYPLDDIKNCTRFYSDGNDVIYGLCDNASQVIDLYNALFNGAEYQGKEGVLDYWKWYRNHCLNSYKEKPSNKRAKRYAEYWKGNHVIILQDMDDFRWHKWGIYIGDFNHKCEYFSDEEGIDHVYSFGIYKVV